MASPVNDLIVRLDCDLKGTLSALQAVRACLGELEAIASRYNDREAITVRLTPILTPRTADIEEGGGVDIGKRGRATRSSSVLDPGENR